MRRLVGLLAMVGLLLLPLLALGQDPAAVPVPVEGLPVSTEYLLNLGPFGALIWGAYMLGKGVRMTLQIEPDEETRELLRRGVEALEASVRQANRPSA